MKNFKEKTWDNLSEGDILIDKDGNERAIIQILGRLLFISVIRSFNDYEFTRTAEQLVRLGYKIKGASEDKPSISDVIEYLERCTEGFGSNLIEIQEAIEMLKKIKCGKTIIQDKTGKTLVGCEHYPVGNEVEDFFNKLFK